MRTFQSEEIRDIVIAIVVLTIIFAYPDALFSIQLILLYFVAVVTGFLFHELAHKFSANKYGCYAQFKLWPIGLVFGLLFTIISGGNIKFVAPGAVMIFPFRFGRWRYRTARLTHSEEGVISASGPAINLAFALLFTLLPITGMNFLIMINAWLALFNLLPIRPLDGAKVFSWKPWVWIIMMVISILLLTPYFI